MGHNLGKILIEWRGQGHCSNEKFWVGYCSGIKHPRAATRYRVCGEASGIQRQERCEKKTDWDPQGGSVVEHLPLAQGVILESWDQVPHRAPRMEPASPSAYVYASLCVCVCVSHE